MRPMVAAATIARHLTGAVEIPSRATERRAAAGKIAASGRKFEPIRRRDAAPARDAPCGSAGLDRQGRDCRRAGRHFVEKAPSAAATVADRGGSAAPHFRESVGAGRRVVEYGADTSQKFRNVFDCRDCLLQSPVQYRVGGELCMDDHHRARDRGPDPVADALLIFDAPLIFDALLIFKAPPIRGARGCRAPA
jgi:hypothetical protein